MPTSSSPFSQSSAASPYWTAAWVGAVTAVSLWKQHYHHASQKSIRTRRRKSSGDDASPSETTVVSIQGSVMMTLPTWAITNTHEYYSRHYTSDEEMMSLAIHLSDLNVSEGTGGPFGAAVFERHYYNEHGSGSENSSSDGATTSASGIEHDDKEQKSYCTLVSTGMNRVVPLGNSTLHAEMVAIQLAQRKIGSFTLMVDRSDDGGNDDNNGGGMNSSCHCNSGSGLFLEDDDEGSDRNDDQDTTNAKGGENDAGKSNTAPPTIPTVETTTPPKKRQFELFSSCEPCAMCLGATLWSGVSRLVCAATKSDAQAIGFDEGPVFQASYDHLEKCGVAVTRKVLTEEAAVVLRRYGNEGVIYNR